VLVCNGPKIFEWTNPSILVALVSPTLGNDAQCCLPSIQHLHEVKVFSLNVSILLNILWMSSNLLLLIWPSQRCHKLVVLRLTLIRTTIAYLMGLMVSSNLYKSDSSLHYAIFHLLDSWECILRILWNFFLQNCQIVLQKIDPFWDQEHARDLEFVLLSHQVIWLLLLFILLFGELYCHPKTQLANFHMLDSWQKIHFHNTYVVWLPVCTYHVGSLGNFWCQCRNV
jgi:hypothetical protein